MFQLHEAARGVLHVQDALGVCFTLLTGDKSGLLIDTGYGLESVRALADRVCSVPYQVLLTHGHHDHILGAADFASVLLCAEDAEEYRRRSGIAQRRIIAERAAGAGLPVPEDYLTRAMPDPDPIVFPERMGPFACCRFDLGGMTAEVLHVPGHTPGSAVVLIRERKLLLTGDDWNPCTWLWFPSSLGYRSWRKNMEALLMLPFDSVLCSHQPDIRSREEIEDWFHWLTKERVLNAEPADMGSEIRTCRCCLPEKGYEFVFDRDKVTL